MGAVIQLDIVACREEDLETLLDQVPARACEIIRQFLQPAHPLPGDIMRHPGGKSAEKVPPMVDQAFNRECFGDPRIVFPEPAVEDGLGLEDHREAQPQGVIQIERDALDFLAVHDHVPARSATSASRVSCHTR